MAVGVAAPVTSAAITFEQCVVDQRCIPKIAQTASVYVPRDEGGYLYHICEL
jgi:hypothetical protein